MWNYKTPGIPDEEFERTEEVPITKEEVRAIQISKARLSLGQTVYDIGCGSGSISVEAGLQVESSGKVYAIDFDLKAVELTKKNLKKLKPGGRIVVGVILIETLFSVLEIMDKLDFRSVDITQITISKSRKTSTGTMMLARNPVTIISATKF